MRSALVLAVLFCAAPLAAQQITEQQLLGQVEFRGLHAVSKKVVWASGSGGWVYHTTTGGEHWTIDTIPGATNLFLVDIWAKDDQKAWVVGTDFRGGYAAIYATVNGGTTWERQWELRDSSAFLDGITCTRDGVCWALGDPIGGDFLLLSNWTGTWERHMGWFSRERNTRLPKMLDHEAAFAASGTEITSHGNTLWFVTGGGTHARVWRYASTGHRPPDWRSERGVWTAVETPLPGGASAGLFGIAMENERRGLAVGGDYQLPNDSAQNVLRTTDGGRTWALTGRTLPIGVRWGLTSGGHGLYLATAPTGTGITRDGGATWSVLDTKPANTAGCAGGVCWLAGKNRLAKVMF
ncbi:MAG TPA: hypothetical protein VF454_03750 [Gemmatimonadales bacterium]